MPPLTAETYINHFAELFWPLVQQEQERQAVLEGAFYSENWVLGEIVLGGKPRPFAKQCLVTLHRLRPGDGRLLAILLDNLWYDVGEAGQAKITALRDFLPHFCAHVAAHTAPPAAIESAAKISQQIEPGVGSVNINVVGNLTMRDVTNAPQATSSPANAILSPAVYLSYSDSDPMASALAAQAAQFLQAHGHPCRRSHVPDYIGSDAWLGHLLMAHNAAYMAVILITRHTSRELEIDHTLLFNKQQQGKHVLIWQPDPAVAVPSYLTSLPVVTTLDDLLNYLPATRGVALADPGWTTGNSRRAREKAYLDDLLARELRHVSRYTPLSGQSLIRATSTGRLAFDPIVARPEFAHSPWRQAQRDAADVPTETRRFEDPVPELQRIQQAVLLGEPGAGKTTTLYKLASDLAHRLAEDPRAPLPLLIPLGLWTDATQPLPDFLASQLGALGADLPALLAEGRAALLLDGLNEIPAPQHAAKYAQVKAFIAAERAKNPDLVAIVTCREQDYPPGRRLALDQVEIAPLDPVRVHSFACRYVGDEAGERLFWQLAGEAAEKQYAGFMARVGRKLDAPWATFWLATELPQNLHLGWLLEDDVNWNRWLDQRRQPQSLLRLAFNPYLLTMLVDVWCTAEGQLPTNRGQLFAGFVDILLRREDNRLPEEEKLIGTPLGAALLHALSELAYAMQSATDGFQGEKARTALPLAEAAQVLTDRQRYLAASANLITLRGEELRFTHQLLQEYFAARALQRQLFPNGDPTATPTLDPTTIWSPENWWEPTNWEETVILLAGLYSDDCTSVLRWLADAQPELASRCIVESGADVPEATLLWLRQKWMPRLTDQQNEPEPLSRAGVGRALGRLTLVSGELLDNRLGVGLRADSLPDIIWGGVVPVGTYDVGGDGKYDGQKRTWRIEEPYQLAKYPITYVQFQAFVEAADFHDARWWANMPEEEKEYGNTYVIKEIAEQRFPYATHPREMLSWYQAVAFCRWLSDKLDEDIRLPHEYEWEVAARFGHGRVYQLTVELLRTINKEVAARFGHGRVYPWGRDEIEVGLANYKGFIGQTTAVGLYPAGRQAQLDLYDLTGNVEEWCQNQVDDVAQVGVDASAARRAVRGGSWGSLRGDARVAYRNDFHPYYRFDDLGLRVVRRPPSHL